MKTTSFLTRAVRFSAVAALLVSIPLTITACSKKDGAGTTGASSGALTPGGAKIEVDATSHDFGKIPEGDKVKHTFTVRNKGDAPLILERVQTSCGCTVAELKTKEIPPGGTGEIDVTFDTRGRVGPNNKPITIVSNDASSPRTKVEIKANIERLLGFQPFSVRLNLAHGEEKTSEAWLTGQLAKDAKLAIAKAELAENVTAEIAEKKEGDTVVKGLRIKVKGDKVGTGSGRVTLSTGVEKTPEIVMPVSWAVSGNIDVVPRGLYFDPTSPAGRERTIRVTSKKADFALKGAKVLSGPFKAEFTKPETGPGFQVVVKMTEDTAKPDGSQNGKLELVSNDPLEPKLELPLTVRTMPKVPHPGSSGVRGLVKPEGPGKRPDGPGKRPAPPPQ